MNKIFKDNFINQYIKENNLSIVDSNEDKPWGGYYIYEANDKFDKKILAVKPGQYMSLQFHGNPNHPGHSEKWTALTKLKVVLGNRSAVGLSAEELKTDLQSLRIITLEPNEEIEIPSGFLHAFTNPFSFNSYCLEVRTSQVDETYEDRENNIIRIYDQSGREGTVPWPEALTQKIQLFSN